MFKKKSNKFISKNSVRSVVKNILTQIENQKPEFDLYLVGWGIKLDTQ